MTNCPHHLPMPKRSRVLNVSYSNNKWPTSQCIHIQDHGVELYILISFLAHTKTWHQHSILFDRCRPHTEHLFDSHIGVRQYLTQSFSVSFLSVYGDTYKPIIHFFNVFAHHFTLCALNNYYKRRYFCSNELDTPKPSSCFGEGVWNFRWITI